MTHIKDEALRIADCIDPPQIFVSPEMRTAAAAELRRLHKANQALNQTLLEALKLVLEVIAVGDGKKPQQDACDSLIEAGLWEQEAQPEQKLLCGTKGCPDRASCAEALQCLLFCEDEVIQPSIVGKET